MWKDYLSFSRREQRGLVVLVILIVLLIFFRIFFPFFLPSSEIEIIKLDSSFFSYKPQTQRNFIAPIVVNYELSDFDPNNITADFLIEIGINQRIARNWHNYILKGGGFTKPEDILKIYGMDSSLFHQLSPYIKIPKTAQNDNKLIYLDEESKSSDDQWNIDSIFVSVNSETRYVKKTYIPDLQIELNSADTSQLMMLKGIGQVLSARIINYRKKLGGFVSNKQLLEVYGIKSEVIDNNINIITIDTTLVLSVNINTASISRLRDHPYLDFYKAQAIIEQRKKKPFQNTEEVLILDSFSDVDWNILKFYLSVENK